MIVLCLASSTTPRRRNLLVTLAQYTVTHFRSSCWFLRSLIRNEGRLGSLKPTVPARNSINPIKMVKLTKTAVKGSVDNFSFHSMLLESQILPKPLAKRLILNFFHQSFLSRNVSVSRRAIGHDVINGRSQRTAQ